MWTKITSKAVIPVREFWLNKESRLNSLQSDRCMFSEICTSVLCNAHKFHIWDLFLGPVSSVKMLWFWLLWNWGVTGNIHLISGHLALIWAFGKKIEKKRILEDRGHCTLVPWLSVIFQNVSSHFDFKAVCHLLSVCVTLARNLNNFCGVENITVYRKISMT